MNTLTYTIPDFSFNEISTSFNYFFTGLNVGTIQKSKNNNLEESKPNQRILTHFRNELHVLEHEDIAYIYIENSITYVVDNEGRKRVSNKSLEMLYKDLDNKDFFKANRQVILSAAAIKKIVKIDNNKLKIETNPEPEKMIIVGKNKAAEFKRWLKA